MKNEKKIFTIAFEGESRVGKGTQIEMIKNKLRKMGIPCISIRGEGYRNGEGNSEDDPASDYWKKISEMLKNGIDKYESWNEASYRLARELLVWRDRILSREIDKSIKPFGVLLIDRSLISNSILKTLQKKPQPGYTFRSDELYPKHLQNRKKITTEMVSPDIIFELIAPKEVLLSRLDKNHPEYEFKKNNIENKYNLYLEAKKHLPKEIQDIIVPIDSSGAPEEVFSKILREISIRFPELEVSQNNRLC